MATAMAKKSKKSENGNGKPAFEQKALFALEGQALKNEDAADVLQSEFMEVTVKINWLTTQKQVEEKLAAKIRGSVKANKRGLSLAKRLFDSGHPAVKKLNEAKRLLNAYIDSMTINSAEIPITQADGTVRKMKMSSVMSGGTATAEIAKEVGVRLIHKDFIDEFHDQVLSYIKVLYAAVAELDKKLESVKDHDQKNLGDTFNPDDYPDSVVDLINVRGPYYKQTGLGVDFEKRCPKTCQMILEARAAKMDANIEVAVGTIAAKLLKHLKMVSRQLGNRVRLRPNFQHPLVKLREAEVIKYLDCDTCEELAEGQVLITVRYKPEGSRVNIEEEIGPLKLVEYAALNPYETAEKCKVYDSAVQELLEFVEHAHKYAGFLGSGGASIRQAADKLGELLTQGGKDAADVAEALRKQTFLRNTVKKTADEVLDFVADKLVDAIEAVAPKKGKRRSIGAKKG